VQTATFVTLRTFSWTLPSPVPFYSFTLFFSPLSPGCALVMALCPVTWLFIHAIYYSIHAKEKKQTKRMLYPMHFFPFVLGMCRQGYYSQERLEIQHASLFEAAKRHLISTWIYHCNQCQAIMSSHKARRGFSGARGVSPLNVPRPSQLLIAFPRIPLRPQLAHARDGDQQWMLPVQHP